MFYSLCIKYHGKASHASAYPWEGVNALDAAVLAYNNVSVLRQQLKPDWKIQGRSGCPFKIKSTYFEVDTGDKSAVFTDITKKTKTTFHDTSAASKFTW